MSNFDVSAVVSRLTVAEKTARFCRTHPCVTIPAEDARSPSDVTHLETEP
jgi:hypothetical protein